MSEGIKMKRVVAQRAFTLIEVMVVVIIMAILAAMVVPRIINRPDQAKLVVAKQDVMVIENALSLYKLDNGFYPSSEQGLKALVEKPTTEPVPQNWTGPYLKNGVPNDPWGRPYRYLNPGQHGDIDVFTYGANNQPGGEGNDAEVGNWNAKTKG